MYRRLFVARAVTLAAVLGFVFLGTVSAYWVWTPETKKFVNPKYAPKDSPKEQFDWATGFYDARDYQRAAAEFEKVTKHYEYSEYAARSQYYVGLCYENMGKYYTAFQNYQKAVDNFPHIDNMEEIVAREFSIAKLYASKDNPKVLGTDIMTSLDRAIDIYKKVVDNAPYGKLADEAQYEMGLALKRSERYDEAIEAFQKILDDYPASRFIDKAQYEVADCAYRSSLSPAYDVGPTDKAIKAFEELAEMNRDQALTENAARTVQRLKDKAAEKSLITAKFYEEQKRYESAIIYYQDILDRFPDSSHAIGASKRINELREIIANPKAKVIKAVEKKKKVKQPKKKKPKIKKESKPWNLFGLGKKKGPGTVETSAVKPDVKRKLWSFFGVGRKKELKAGDGDAPGAKQQAKKEKKATKSWDLFGFGKKKEAEVKESVVVKGVDMKEEKPEAKTEVPEQKEELSAVKEEALEGEKPEAMETAAETKTEQSSVVKTETETPKVETAVEAKTEAPKVEAVVETKADSSAQKKPWAPFKFEKSTDAGAKKEKKAAKPWTPFNLDHKGKEAKKAEEPKQAKKEPWDFFGFGKKKSKIDTVSKIEVPRQKKEKKTLPWAPFKFEKSTDAGAKKEKKAAKPWTPFNLEKKETKKAEEPKQAKKEPWDFFGFGKKKEINAEEPVIAKSADTVEENKAEIPETAAGAETEPDAERYVVKVEKDSSEPKGPVSAPESPSNARERLELHFTGSDKT